MLMKLLASDNYIIVNKSLIQEYGINEAIMLGELASEYLYWERQDKLENEYFYSTVENIEKQTTLSGHQQRAALQKLEEMGIVQTKRIGMPSKRYIKINQEQLLNKLTSSNENFKLQLLKNLTSSSEKIEEQDVKKFNTNNNNLNSNNNSNNNNNLEKPTKKQIEDYCSIQGITNINLDDFYSYYDANDWWDDLRNRPINWKQKLVSWKMNQKGTASTDIEAEKKRKIQEILESRRKHNPGLKSVEVVFGDNLEVLQVYEEA